MTIREARIAAGLTQKQLAEQLGVGRTTVTGWESGTGMPRAARLRDIAALLGCTVDDILSTEVVSDHNRD